MSFKQTLIIIAVIVMSLSIIVLSVIFKIV